MGKRNIAYISVLRCIACFCIVVLHSAMADYMNAYAGGFSQSQTLLYAEKILYLVMNGAVPVFVMISGALLLDENRNIGLRKIFFKYIPKMLVSLVFFTLLFSVIDAVRFETDIADALEDGLINILTDGSWIHMWYLYMMIAVYLMLPIYRLVTRSAGRQEIIYMLVLYAVFLVVIDVSFTALSGVASSGVTELNETLTALGSQGSSKFYIFTAKVWPLYLFLGYALNKGYIKIKPIVAVIMLIVGIGAIAVMVITGNKTGSGSVKIICNTLTTNNSSPVFFLLACSSYSLAMRIGEIKNGFLKKLTAEVDKCTFGIYLLHLILIKLVLSDIKLDPAKYGGIFGILVFSLIDFIACFAVTWVYGKAKGVIFKARKGTENKAA